MGRDSQTGSGAASRAVGAVALLVAILGITAEQTRRFTGALAVVAVVGLVVAIRPGRAHRRSVALAACGSLVAAVALTS